MNTEYRCHRCLPLTVAIILVVSLAVPPLPAQWEPEPVDTGLVGLGLALRRLQTTASLLYITAHPDDEDNGLFARLSRGKGMRVGTLTLTRSEGGQNEIGPELSDALGVLRTEELLATHRLDGVEQYFGSVVDFGYSFSVEETFRKWGHDETVRDIVRVLRRFRPEIVVTLRPDGAGGGQHHQASARLATEAFSTAGDPDLYPGLRSENPPWRARKLYRALWSPSREEQRTAIEVELGDYDPLLGMSYAEFGALARNRHRSQGMNRPPAPGAQSRWYAPVIPAERTDLLDGIPSLAESLSFVASLPGESSNGEPKLVGLARSCLEKYETGRHSEVPSLVMQGLAEVRRLAELVQSSTLEAGVRAQASFLLGEEEKDWLDAAAKAHHLFCDAQVGRESVDGLFTPGEVFVAETRLVNRGGLPVRVKETRVETPAGWKVTRLDPGARDVPYNATSLVRFEIEVRENEPPAMLHWRRGVVEDRTQSSLTPVDACLPFARPPVRAVWVYEALGVEAKVETPVVYRWYDAEVAKQRSYAIKVMPPVAVRLSPDERVIPAHDREKARDVEVLLHAYRRGVNARIELALPPFWDCQPSAREVTTERENETASVRFRVTPPSRVRPGAYDVSARVIAGGKPLMACGLQRIAYHHVETRHLYRPARTTFRVIPVRVTPGLEVGYVMGVGDRVAEAIEQLGARLTLLTAQDLSSGDLGRYDAIVLGVRAYKDRQDLIANNRRLLAYVHEGGVLLVQYNKYEFISSQYGPYPCSISRPHDRVTDEAAPVRVLVPESPVFHTPNRIVAADWDGWVQERGLYFLGDWDARYTPLLEIEDSFAYNAGPRRGGLVLARYGRGAYIYTGLSFFRQLPAGVPGAYRLFANLISLKSSLK